MLQIVVSRYGEPEVLIAVSGPIPIPRPNEVRIKVAAAGVAFADMLRRRGAVPGTPKPPFVPGFDVVGTVDAVGSLVGEVAIGARVAALVGLGGYAEAVCAEGSSVAAVPDGVTDADAVAAVLTYGTAFHLLNHAGAVQPGQTIVVPGAAGGVGSALVQLAVARGVRTIGLASARKLNDVRKLGSEPVDEASADIAGRINELTGGRGADVVFDAAGGKSLWAARKFVRRGGRIVTFGSANVAGRDGSARKGRILSSLGSMALLAFRPGVRLSMYVNEIEMKKNRGRFMAGIAEVLAMMDAGKVQPLIAATMELGEAAAAHRLLESGNAIGKIVLTTSAAAHGDGT